MNSPQRQFLPWDEPCLPQAAVWLIDRYRDQRLCDMQRVLCVTPIRRAGRLLTAMLTEACQGEGLVLLPPRCITPGDLGERLLPIAGALASSQEARMAWEAAAQGVAAEDLQPLLPRDASAFTREVRRDLAGICARLHDEVRSEGASFRSIARRLEKLDQPSEVERWKALETILQRYRRLLRDAGLTDRHDAITSALTRAAESDEHRRDLILIGAVDLNHQQRRTVECCSARTIALIHAPRSLADHFDSLGCVIPDRWARRPIELEDQQIESAAGPFDQAQSVMSLLARLPADTSVDDVTIGTGDDRLADPIRQAGHWARLPIHDSAGRALDTTAPFRLLEGLAEWIESGRFEHLASLLRHPDVESHVFNRAQRLKLEVATDWLTLLDRYFSEHLHEQIDGTWLGDTDHHARLAAAYDAVQELASLFERGQPSLAVHCASIGRLLELLYASRSAHGKNRADVRAAEALRDAILPFARCPTMLQPEMSAPEALRFLLAQVGETVVPPEVEEDEVEMLGWLELHLDTAPYLILAGVNDGSIPQMGGPDAFLPNTLRQETRLLHNDRRLGRDAYQFQAILKSRQVTLITGRQTAEGDPLTPSRFLLACDDDTLVRRVLQLCPKTHDALRRTLPIGAPPPAPDARFGLPPLPESMPAPEAMSVTEFKIYLQCPYRYALSRLLRLKTHDDDRAELDALQFGSLAHDVLKRFGRDQAMIDCEDERVIRAFLLDQLHMEATRFGHQHLPAVRLQLARLEQRLCRFATLQAQWRREGWRITECELEMMGDVSLDIPGDAPMPLRGIIDRVDEHDSGGRWRIIDYKTSEGGRGPEQMHRDRDGDWIDLQLPLYRYMMASAPERPISGAVELGYIVMPRKVDDVALLVGDWSESEIESGIERARQVVRDIRAGEFGWNPEHHPRWDDFARICRTTVYQEQDALASAEAEGDAV